MITIDITMIIQIINVLILIVIMNAVLYKPVRSILDQREKRLAGMEGDIENFNKNAKLRLQEFDQKMNDARRQSKSKLDEVRQQVQTAMNEKIAAIRSESDAMKSEQLAKIKDEMATAQKELKGEVEGFAAVMAEKVLGRSL